MSRELLLDLNGSHNGPFRGWLNACDGEPRIAWYPSSGEDFRDLFYLNPRFSDYCPPKGPEPRHPDIFLHTDYFPWSESALLDTEVLYKDGRSRIKIEEIEELPPCHVPIDPEIVDFPDGSHITGRVVFLHVSVTSHKFGTFSATVIYAFVENESFCTRKILPQKGKMSHVIHVRYGGGIGGGGKSTGIWLLNVLRKVQCEVLVTDNRYHRQSGDEAAYRLYPELSGSSDVTRLGQAIRVVPGKSWSCYGDVSWHPVRPA